LSLQAKFRNSDYLLQQLRVIIAAQAAGIHKLSKYFSERHISATNLRRQQMGRRSKHARVSAVGEVDDNVARESRGPGLQALGLRQALTWLRAASS
jgi:hypothetical protein